LINVCEQQLRAQTACLAVIVCDAREKPRRLGRGKSCVVRTLRIYLKRPQTIVAQLTLVEDVHWNLARVHAGRRTGLSGTYDLDELTLTPPIFDDELAQ
jgi:hypothetical protein